MTISKCVGNFFWGLFCGLQFSDPVVMIVATLVGGGVITYAFTKIDARRARKE